MNPHIPISIPLGWAPVSPPQSCRQLSWVLFLRCGSGDIILGGTINLTTFLGVIFFICLHFDNNDRLTIFVGALDGGAQVMIFILSFAVFGASGTRKPFPTWAGNPAVGNVDYCNGNGALDAN